MWTPIYDIYQISWWIVTMRKLQSHSQEHCQPFCPLSTACAILLRLATPLSLLEGLESGVLIPVILSSSSKLVNDLLPLSPIVYMHTFIICTHVHVLLQWFSESTISLLSQGTSIFFQVPWIILKVVITSILPAELILVTGVKVSCGVCRVLEVEARKVLGSWGIERWVGGVLPPLAIHLHTVCVWMCIYVQSIVFLQYVQMVSKHSKGCIYVQSIVLPCL